MPDAPDQPVVCDDPVFILTASRSGSTLLRFILDTHPDFACPPETMITAGCVALLRSWDILENAATGRHRLVTESARVPDEAIDTIRSTVDRLYGRYLARRGKPRWCDKSLDSHLNAPLLAEMFPRAKFVCLYRHCMDVIASGIEVCPWGVSRFGFDGYVAQNPGNNVAAIGEYWADCAQMILAFEEHYPDRCHRVRYEDLVTDPETVTAGLLTFLGAAQVPGITSVCFGVPHESDGPGDEKIWFTDSVSADAIGRGVRVPAAALPRSVLESANEALAKLGYRPIDDDWNKAPGPVDSRLPDTIRRTTPPAGDDRGQGWRESDAGSVLKALRERIDARVLGGDDQAVSNWPSLSGGSVTLVVTGGQDHDELNWTFSGSADQSDGASLLTMIAGPQVWQALLDGEANMIVEIRSGRLRCVNLRDAHRVRSDEVHAVAWLLGLAQVPLAQLAVS